MIAQSPTPQPATEIRDLTGLSLEELLQYRLITASRYLEDPRKSPGVVTAIGSDEIARYGWRTLADLLRSVPGLYTGYSITQTYLGVRGHMEPGDFNTRVLLMIDGHRINDNLTNMAEIGADFPLDLSLIDHVEVLRGAGSSLYGTDAELTVINVFTRHPDVKPTIAVNSEADSFLGRKLEIGASYRAGSISGILDGSIYRENGLALPRLSTGPAVEGAETGMITCSGPSAGEASAYGGSTAVGTKSCRVLQHSKRQWAQSTGKLPRGAISMLHTAQASAEIRKWTCAPTMITLDSIPAVR